MKDSFIGRKVVFSDSLGSPFYESDIYVLGTNLYVMTYYNKGKFETEQKDYFINSIKIKNPEMISQFNGKSLAYRLGSIFGGFVFYILVGVIILVIVLPIVKFARHK